MSYAGSGATGERYLTERLGEVRRLRAEGRECLVVFDVDNTLFDTRGRTAWIAHAFDRAAGTSYFDGLDLERVGVDAVGTCAKVGLVDARVVAEFVVWWEQQFWDGAAFAHDIPVPSTIAWAQRAMEAGASLGFLTGRIEALRAPTTEQLDRAGLLPGTLWMKPDLATWTLSFKAGVLQNVSRQMWLGWYATEGRAEIAHLQRVMPGGPWVRVECSLQDGGPEVAAETPTLQRIF